MDAMRTRTATRIKCTTTCPKAEQNVSELKSQLVPMLIQNLKMNLQQDVKFSEEEKKTINELKQLYMETINLDVALQRDIYNMEKSYEDKHNLIFEKRKQILE